MSKIVALVDGSIYSRSVCDHAGWAAEALSQPVEVLHVIGRRQTSSAPSDLSGAIGLGARTQLLQELSELDSRMSKLSQTRGRAILEDAVAILKDKGISQATSRLRMGDLLEELHALEEDAELVVIGKRGEAADFASGHLGSNLERIARSAKRPLLVVARSFNPIERALIAFDGGQSSDRAVAFAAESPLLKGVEVHLMTASEATVETRQKLEGAEARLKAAGLVTKTSLKNGAPEKVIADYIEAEQIGLLMMGAYGHSRFRTLIIGSTTAQMVRECRVPVMLFR